MEKKLFVVEMSKLSKLFPQKEIDVEITYYYLEEMPDKDFLEAIKNIVYHEDINQATNIIKLIVDNAVPYKLKKFMDIDFDVDYRRKENICKLNSEKQTNQKQVQ